jgi:hypothetical protein
MDRGGGPGGNPRWQRRRGEHQRGGVAQVMASGARDPISWQPRSDHLLHGYGDGAARCLPRPALLLA